jgi:hypothetical protein
VKHLKNGNCFSRLRLAHDLEAAMADAAEMAEMAEWPKASGKGECSADDDLSSSLLDLMCAAVANSWRLSPPVQDPVSEKSGGCCKTRINKIIPFSKLF